MRDGDSFGVVESEISALDKTATCGSALGFIGPYSCRLMAQLLAEDEALSKWRSHVNTRLLNRYICNLHLFNFYYFTLINCNTCELEFHHLHLAVPRRM